MRKPITYQDPAARCFEGPHALEAAQDFARLATQQVGRTFTARPTHDGASVNLDAWPASEGFGPWFDDLAARFSLTVID